MLQDAMTFIMVALLHLILLGALASGVAAIGTLLLRPRSSLERLLRAASIALGVLIFGLARGTNSTLATVLVRAFGEMSLPWALVTSGVPATLAGALCMGALNSQYKKNIAVRQRVVLIFATLLVAMLGDVYATAWNHGGSVSPLLAPNGSFVVGAILYVILKTPHDESREAKRVVAEDVSISGAGE